MPKIRSIETIDQYIISNGTKDILFTVVGEIHDKETDCETAEQVRIAQVIEERMSASKLFLEFAPGLRNEEVSRMGSTVLRDVYRTEKYPLCKQYGFGIDIRTKILGRHNQTILYNRPDFKELKEILKDKSEYRNLFLETFLKCDLIKKVQECQNPIIQKSIELLQKQYLKVATLLITFSPKDDPDNLFYQTKILWGNLMDLNILYYSSCRDYGEKALQIFVVVGIKHSENIRNILRSIVPDGSTNHLSGCVDTYNLW